MGCCFSKKDPLNSNVQLDDIQLQLTNRGRDGPVSSANRNNTSHSNGLFINSLDRKRVTVVNQF